MRDGPTLSSESLRESELLQLRQNNILINQNAALLEALTGILDRPTPTLPAPMVDMSGIIGTLDQLTAAIVDLRQSVRAQPAIEIPSAPAPNLEPLQKTMEQMQAVLAKLPEQITKHMGTIRVAGSTKSTMRLENAQGELINPAADFATGEILEDQTGNAGVVTFTFSTHMYLICAYSADATSRATAFGDPPTSSKGIVLPTDVPTYITARSNQLKVWAPVGATVSVWGFRP